LGIDRSRVVEWSDMQPSTPPDTVVCIGIVGSSPGGNVRHWRLVEGLRRSVTSALADTPGGSGWIRRPDGEGETLLAPAGTGRANVLAEFVPRLDRALRGHNRGPSAHLRVRVRVAIDHGAATLLRAARLRDIEPLRRAMDNAPQAVVGLAVSDDYYRSEVLAGDPGLDPPAYQRVTAQAQRFYETAWIRLIEGE
jgi:hypothetical protein